jgi:hypothetical protein
MTGLQGIIHFCAENDYYGNPQRCYVLSDETGKFTKAWDEGYSGTHAVPVEWRDEANAAQRYDVSVTKYKELIRNLA